MSECATCDDRGFVFETVDAYHRKQLLCPACQGAPIRAKFMALLLSGEQTNLPEGGGDSEKRWVESAIFRQLPYDQQMMATMKGQLKDE